MNLPNLLSWWLQALAVVAAAALCARWSHARTRLWFWQATLGLCVMLPLFPWRQPAAQAPLASAAGTVASDSSVARVVQPAGIFEGWELWSAGTVLFAIAAGAALRLLWIAIGLWRLRGIRQASELTEPLIPGRARWFISSEIHSPVTYGFVRPVILLPASIMDVDEPLRRAMAEHEVVHIERADWVMVMVEECLRAALWFQPAVWYALAQIQKAREQVVDAEAVLRTGDRQAYLDALLTVAANRLEPDLAPAPLFLKKRQLASRVSALIKDPKESTMSPVKLLSRLIPATAAVAAVLALALWLKPLEAQVPIQADSAGVTVDAGGRLLHRTPIRIPPDYTAGGTLVLDATLSPKGEVTDARVVSGPEALRREALQSVLQWHYDTPGGSPPAARISIQYAARQTAAAALRAIAGPTNRTGAPLSPTARKVTGTQFVGIDGALRDRLEAKLKDYVGKDVTPATLPEISQSIEAVDSHALTTFRDSADHTTMIIEVAMPGESRQEAEARLLRLAREVQGQTGAGASPPAPPPPPPPGVIRVGGNVQSAKLVRQPKPAYPPLARQARIQGTVRFNVIIDREGHVRDMQLVSGHPLLVQEAQEAVRQWVYQPTLLNGQPTEVMTDIDVNFTLADGLSTLFQEQPRN